jgi:hypothetical protein
VHNLSIISKETLQMSDEPAKKDTEATLDGKRLHLHELNLGTNDGSRVGRIRQSFRNLSLFLAGMYTGESCAGTPHSERHSKSSTPSKQDTD